MAEPISARRREVLDTAARLFHERGYQGTSMDEIADAVGLTKGSLYHHFDGKTEILTAIYEEAADMVVSQTEGHADDEPAAEVFRSLIRSILEMIGEHRYHVTIYYQEMRWVQELLPAEDAERIQAKVRTYIDFAEGVIKRGIKEGSLKEVDSRLAAYALIGMASWAYQWYDPKGRLGLDGVVDVFADIYMDGMRK